MTPNPPNKREIITAIRGWYSDNPGADRVLTRRRLEEVIPFEWDRCTRIKLTKMMNGWFECASSNAATRSWVITSKVMK